MSPLLIALLAWLAFIALVFLLGYLHRRRDERLRVVARYYDETCCPSALDPSVRMGRVPLGYAAGDEQRDGAGRAEPRRRAAANSRA